MPRLQRQGDVVHVAFDASKNVLVAGILRGGEETPRIERVFNDEPSIRLREGPWRARRVTYLL
jgi:hypothetical protein